MKNKTLKAENEEQGGLEMDSELHELFLDELADLLNAESQLTKALPKMAKAAQSEELRDALNSHLEETKGHVERLKQVFESLDEKPKSKTCQAMKGLIEEGSELLQELKGVPLHENLGEDYRDNRVEMVREYRDRPGWS